MSAVIATDLEIAFGELLNVVIGHQTLQSSTFKTLLKRLENTLKTMEPLLFCESWGLSKLLARPEKETIMFIFYLENGKDLVLKCSRIRWWNVYKKFVHANKLIRLNNELLRFFQTEMQVNMVTTSIRSLIGIHDLEEKLDRVLSAVTTPVGTSSGSCTVPGIPQLIVGLDLHLEELKHRLLKDETQLLVVSGPGGCGKTTLVKMLCNDNGIKDMFGENIFYVTVSRPSSIKTVAQKLFEHHGENHCKFQSDEEAKNQLENLMWRIRSDKMLLVLDDVWSESESLVQDLKFQIPGYKIVITSRFLFPRFNATYELSLLNHNDARVLLCYSAFPRDGIPVNIVKHCKGLPLALTVVGASLCGQGAIKWRTTFKKWSEGQSILQSHSSMLVSLSASIDALDHELPIVKECFLDLGSFPKDERVAATALMDMWVELYNLDEKGMYTSEHLHELSSRNLVHLVPIRKDVGELEGYCDEHHVTQHDLLRELAVHLSSQEPIAQRNRLFMKIHKNNFPTWWIEQIRQPINARILSISTDEAFCSNWYDLKAPKVEVLILNISSKQYSLPQFIESMGQLKVLSVTSYGDNPAQLHNLPSIGVLSNLKRIRFTHLSVSSSIQPIFALQNLQKLSFVMCELSNAFTNDTTGSPMLPNLTELEFDRCYDLNELPAGLCSLVHLQKLSITNCHELDVLPKGLGRLLNLEFLSLNCCTKLQELPESIGSLLKLRFIDISDCLSISLLPEQIGELCSLRVLKMRGCQGLQDLPVSMSKLLQLEEVICDEETSYLWMDFETDLCNLKINVVEDDRFESFMKIVQ
ncbi:Disease resistance protein [Cynara cardunculus var. scolymus]|uniref:Disease resistance protein n=1 Tax=Cynara cardunculus var. scolymus TaxID=59895 RepID=A0A103YGG4_CYNCS|nr:Disease resistance protein [Cynara cardunculus var. scolymus]